jgi:hypothetical protein
MSEKKKEKLKINIFNHSGKGSALCKFLHYDLKFTLLPKMG